MRRIEVTLEVTKYFLVSDDMENNNIIPNLIQDGMFPDFEETEKL